MRSKDPSTTSAMVDVAHNLTLPERERFPLLRCVMEYMSAYDRKVLDEAEPRLDVVARDLVSYGIELMRDKPFARIVLGKAWHMRMDGVLRGSTIFSNPLTDDLVPIPTAEAMERKGWQLRFLNEFVDDRSHQTRGVIVDRLNALREKLARTGARELSDGERTTLVQLCESLVDFKGASLDQLRKGFQACSSIDGAVRALEALRHGVESVIGGALADDKSRALATIVAHRIATMRSLGVVGAPDDLVKPLGKRLSRFDAAIAELDAGGICASAREMLHAAEMPRLRTALEKILPRDAAAALLQKTTTLDHEALVEWVASHRAALEALYIELIKQSLFGALGMPPRLSSAVRSGALGVGHAIFLESNKVREPWDPSHTLFVHHLAHRPPRILEAVALTGASNVTLVGEFPERSRPLDDDTRQMLRMTLLLAKYDPVVAQRASLASTFGTAEELMSAELDGASFDCQRAVIHAQPPREISLLERQTGGSVAWAVSPQGELVSTLIFDGKVSPAENEWSVTTLGHRWWRAVPRNKIMIASARQLLPAAPAPEDSVVKVSTPPPLPTHTLSERGRLELSSWLDAAEKSGLFKDDPTFNGSSEATALLSVLRQVAKGQPVNSKAFRSIRKLSESFDDPRRRPILRAPRLHDVRDKLGVILATELSARA